MNPPFSFRAAFSSWSRRLFYPAGLEKQFDLHLHTKYVPGVSICCNVYGINGQLQCFVLFF